MRIITNLDNKTWKNQETLKDIQQQIQSQHAQNTEKYQDLRQNVLDDRQNVLDDRQNVLDDRRHSINGWAKTFLFVFSVVSALMYLEVRDILKETEIALKETKKIQQKAEKEAEIALKETKKIQQKAEIALREIENYKKDAKHALESKLFRNKELDKGTKQKVEKYGTKFQRLILSARQEDDYEKAIALWNNIITIARRKDDKKSLAGGYFKLGYSYGKLGNEEKAIDAYKKVTEIESNDYEAYNNMGDAYLKLKEYQEAIGAYKEVIKITSDVHKALYPKLVKITPDDFATDNLLQLSIDHDITFEVDLSMIFADDNFKAYDNMGYAYGELKEYQKAIDAYKEAIKIKPDKHETHYNMGNAYRKLKEYQKAIDAYKEAIKIKPDYHKAKRSLDSVLKQLEEQ